MTDPRTAEAGSDPRQAAYDAVYVYLAATADIPRDLVTRNAIVWQAVHTALDAILGGRTTPDNPPASGDAADSPEAAVDRVRAVITEQRARIADHEPADGYLPMGDPNALWIDTVSNICHDLERALQPRKPAVGMPIHDGPSIAEVTADDRAHWQQREWG